MHLLHRSSKAGSSNNGGARALRRADSSPKPTLCKNDSIKKKRSKRSRLSAALRELRLAAKARDHKNSLLLLMTTGHRRPRTSGSAAAVEGTEGVGPGPSRFGAAVQAGGPTVEFGEGSSGGGRRYASWALAAALVLVLACVVALGKAPAICCCTCAAWWCGGRAPADSACRRDAGAGVLRVQPRAAGNNVYM